MLSRHPTLPSSPAAWIRAAGAFAHSVPSAITDLLAAGGAGIALAHCAEPPKPATVRRDVERAASGRASGRA
jgi:hypothetical protein